VDASSIIDTLTGVVPGASYEAGKSVDFATLYVPANALVATCQALRDTPSLRFNVLLEVVYHLLSVPNRQRLRLKVRVASNEIDGAVPTVQSIWPAAGWPEREVWDMFGIVFAGHGDLRRLLMPEDWEGHPARKDYPVQIRKAAQTYEPLEVSEEEFRANIARDRMKRAH